jgi:hypothetical protein
MPQINLLKQNTTDYSWVKMAVSIFVKLLFLAVLALVGYYGWLYYDSGKRDSKITELNNEVQKAKASIENSTEKGEIFVRQAQIKEQESLISNHVYWSNLFPVLASSTLQRAEYTSMRVTNEGEVALAVTLPDMEHLEKYLQVFDLPAYNAYFSNVRLMSFNRSQSADSSIKLKVDIKMQFDPSVLRYGFKPAVTPATIK